MTTVCSSDMKLYSTFGVSACYWIWLINPGVDSKLMVLNYLLFSNCCKMHLSGFTINILILLSHFLAYLMWVAKSMDLLSPKLTATVVYNYFPFYYKLIFSH